LPVPEWGKAAINATLALATLLLTSVLWRYPVALTALLIAAGVAIYALRPSRTSACIYVVGFVFGPLAEGLSIQTGAWEYASPSVLGIPVWLPFVWGNAALFIQNTADIGKVIFAGDPVRSEPATPDVVAPLAHSIGDHAEARVPDAQRERGFERRRHDDRAEQHVGDA
jgi:Protein of unknown function (DUF2878)